MIRFLALAALVAAGAFAFGLVVFPYVDHFADAWGLRGCL